ELLRIVAIAANEASTMEEAMRITLDKVCDYTGWPIGHAYFPSQENENELLPSKFWHMDDREKFQEFCAITESTRLKSGIELPGRVFSTGKPAWIIDVGKDENFPRGQVANRL